MSSRVTGPRHGHGIHSHKRCDECKHRVGKRLVSLTVKNQGGATLAEPRYHKNPCSCKCHSPGEVDEPVGSVQSASVSPPSSVTETNTESKDD